MSVIPFERDRGKPRKFGAAEARQIATDAGLRTSERELFMLLLRLSIGGRAVERRRAWLAEHLGVTDRTVRRLVGDLERRQLLHVDHGSGRKWSTYRVNFAALNIDVSPVKPAVKPSESMSPQGGHFVPAEGSDCPPREEETSPQGGQNVPPLRTRDARGAGASPEIHQKDSPLPQTSPSDGLTGELSPVASDGAPSPEKCIHGRTARQGCRRCGTDSRTSEKKARAETAEAERLAAIERARQRLEEEQLATPAPAGWRDQIKTRKDQP